jgi:predicted phosphodiesterase
MRLMIAGDVHGNWRHAIQLVQHAVEQQVQHIVVTGDWGFWQNYHEGVKELDMVNESARHANVLFNVVLGNHDDYDYHEFLTKFGAEVNTGWLAARSNILYAPRVHKWKWDGKNFLGVAGAVSIDKAYRLDYQRRRGHKIWWEQERITDTQVSAVYGIARTRHTDYFISHECSDKTPFRGRLKPDLDSQHSRGQIDTMLRSARPRFHFHGHMHTKYEWENMVPDALGEPHYISTYGLDMDGTWDSWGILDTATDTFAWRGVPAVEVV